MCQRTNLQDEVLSLSSGTSEKYVPQPSRLQIQSDILLGLRRFKNAVRWKEFSRLAKIEANASDKAVDDKAPTTNKYKFESKPKVVKDDISIPLYPKNKNI